MLSSVTPDADQHRQVRRPARSPRSRRGSRRSPVRWPVAITTVGVEELEVAGQLGDRPVGDDGVAAVLDVDVGEDADIFGAQERAVAHRLGRAALHEAFVGDVGVGPLVHPDEGSPARDRRGEGRHGALASTLTPTGTPVARRTRSVTTAMAGRRLGADVLGLEKGMSPWFSTISPCIPPAIGPRRRAGRPYRSPPSSPRDSAARPGRAGSGSSRSAPCRVRRFPVSRLDVLSEISLHPRSFRKRRRPPYAGPCHRQRGAGRDDPRGRPPVPGASILGVELSRDLGGKGTNQAVVLGRAGLPTPPRRRRSGAIARAGEIRSALARGPVEASLVDGRGRRERHLPSS